MSPALAGGLFVTEPPGKPGSCFFFFLIMDSFSLQMIGLFKLCFFFSFGGLCISRKLSISLRLSNLLAYNCT